MSVPIVLSDADQLLYDQALEAECARRFLHYKPYEQQLKFHAAEKIAQEVLFLGGNRTGKTYCASNATSMHVTGSYPYWWPGYVFEKPINAWVVGPSNKFVRDTLQKQYYFGDKRSGRKGLIHPSLIVDIDKGRGLKGMIDTAYIKHVLSGGVSTVTFWSTEQGADKFQGDQIDLGHIDEESPIDRYKEILMRTMQTREGFRGLLLVSMTPLKGMTELMMHFLDGRSAEHAQDSRWHIHASWDDNPYLAAEEKKRMLAAMSPHEIEARTKGIPWLGSGLVYPVPESMVTCDPFEIPKHWARVFGMDFGWSKPTAVLFCAYDRDNGKLYAYAEYYVTELTPQKHAVNLIELGANWMPGVYDPAGDGKTIIDGEKIAQLYRKSGVKNIYPAIKGKDSKESGVMSVLEMMQNDRLFIFKNLKHTLRELRMYSRDEKGKIKKGNDHLMDSLRYTVTNGLSIARPKNFNDPMYNGRYGGSQVGYI